MIPAIVYGTVEDAIVNLSDEHSINSSHYLYVDDGNFYFRLFIYVRKIRNVVPLFILLLGPEYRPLCQSTL
jgi:hypothetical protein